MGDEDEDGIIIQEGQHEEEFSVRDANNAEKVQQRFMLDSKPQFVLFGKKGKEVRFGDLKDAGTYRLPKSQILIPHQKIHRQNAVILSQAVYDSHPLSKLNENIDAHTVKTICDITKYSDQKAMLAVGEVDGSNVLYVAYRGSKSRSDFMADFDFKLRTKKGLPGGKYHAGFAERSETIKVDYILNCAQKKNCQTIVTCGHSLGGAVSSIVALNLMIKTVKDVYNITFGAPLFANETVKKSCAESERRMVQYLNCEDIVPGLLSLEHTISWLKKTDIHLPGDIFICPLVPIW